MFAPDHAAIARELARVCRSGGRLGLTQWLPKPELERLWERLGYARPAAAGRPRDWSRPEYVRELLGGEFELDFVEGISPWTGESGEAIWQLSIGSDGPAKAGLRRPVARAAGIAAPRLGRLLRAPPLGWRRQRPAPVPAHDRPAQMNTAPS